MRDLGRKIFGLGAVLLGVVGLFWADFALVWQPVPAGIPGRTLLALLTGTILALSGLALEWRRTACSGALTLAGLFALGVLLLHVPKVAAHPLALSPWAGVAEQSALVAGALLAYAACGSLAQFPRAALFRAGWLVFGLCCVIFGAVHFRYEYDTAQMVPRYLPLGQIFWARAAGAAHISAGLAVLSGVRARIAAGLLTAMFVVFQAVVHVPLLISNPASHLAWVMNGMNLCLVGAAWVVTDSLKGRSMWNVPAGAE